MFLKGYIKQSSNFIEEVSCSALAKDLNLTFQAVFNWKRRGIPRAYLKYLNITYKDLIQKYELLKE